MSSLGKSVACKDPAHHVLSNLVNDADPPEDAQSDVLRGEDGKVPEDARSQNDEVQFEQLAKGFAANVPELKFSPAEIQSFLLANKQSPDMAVAKVDSG